MSASNIVLLPLVMQTPVAYMETSSGRFTWLWGIPYLTVAITPFKRGNFV